jgi:epoxyqueuosine reductase
VMDEGAWRVLSEGSPLKRAGRSGLARNAAIVLGNRRDRGALQALREAAVAHDDETVRDAAAWGCEQLGRVDDGVR